MVKRHVARHDLAAAVGLFASWHGKVVQTGV
jgi:hypothetical protein